MNKSKMSHDRFAVNRVIGVLLVLALLCFEQKIEAQHTVARQWNEVLLDAIRSDFARPTVHARNLFHSAVAMYDSWAAYDSLASTYLLGQTVAGFDSEFTGVAIPSHVDSARAEAMSFAMYRLLRSRFAFSPGREETFQKMNTLIADLGYDVSFDSEDYENGPPAALGNYIARTIIDFGAQDGANEMGSYENQYYESINPPLIMDFPGNADILDPNRWQPLTLDVFIDQSGNVIPLVTPDFLSPEWGQVLPFALQEEDLTVYQRDDFDYLVYHDPGAPPYLDTIDASGLSDEYKWGFELVSVWSSHLDPADSVMIDISPASIGNNPAYPQTLADYPDFYDLIEGGDASKGHTMNPKTGLPYEEQLVPRADYARVLAEFWADGPDSETPPGHWFTLLNYVNDHPETEKRFEGTGEVIDDLEWDVKSYLLMGGAMHDVAITAWGIKGWYDYIRPVSALRYLAQQGQSSDPQLPNYSTNGLRLLEGYIELVDEDDPLVGVNDKHLGKIKIKAWKGPDYIQNPMTDVAEVDWILAEDWWPYQRPSFVTPPFAGYISGHSTYSSAAATILTMLTGDPYFPGGIGEFTCPKNEFLVFEEGPSQSVTLQWATYKDAADQCSLSRIWGGIHPPADDIPGRVIGPIIGEDVFTYAKTLFKAVTSPVIDLPLIQQNVKVYPNPVHFTDQFILEVDADKKIISVEMIDMQGKKVLSRFDEEGIQTMGLGGQAINTGIYLLHIRGTNWRSVEKISVVD